MSSIERISLINKMKEIIGLVEDKEWVVKAREFVQNLESVLMSIHDNEFFEHLRTWQRHFLDEVMDQIIVKLAIQAS